MKLRDITMLALGAFVGILAMLWGTPAVTAYVLAHKPPAVTVTYCRDTF